MIPQIKNHQNFIYRNSSELKSFDISNEFVFICTENRILQFQLNNPVPTIGILGFSPIFSGFSNKKFFVTGKRSLFYFQYELFKLADLEALALCFFYRNFFLVLNGESNRIFIYEISQKDKEITDKVELTRTIEFLISDNSKNGLCSAHFVHEDQIYLGFESGLIASLNGSELSLSSVNLNFILTVKDPVISIVFSKGFLFVLTLSKLFRFCKERSTELNEFTQIEGRSIHLYNETLILVQEKRLVFFNFDLSIKRRVVSLERIKQIKILGDLLYVGYVNGMLIEYSLDKIISEKDYL